MFDIDKELFMDTVFFDMTRSSGKIKPMHGVNNGPVCAKNGLSFGNFEEYKDAKIPYARTHDASFCAEYGGEHTVDIQAIFPNFDADESAPASYDFFYTDEYLKTILDAGTQVFFRLGSKIEHGMKKYGTLPPKDFPKWARICEHIIRHYNEGWADGFHWHIVYWEIWNEPDGGESTHKPTWSGTREQFFEFFSVAACHLKACFPHLMIGGPALAWRYDDYMPEFLDYLASHHVPLDFFSWHAYNTRPCIVSELAVQIRSALDSRGFTKTESILDEWNYIEDFDTHYARSLQTITSMRGAAFTAACMCVGQYAPVDQMMYYDARPSGFNGLFDMVDYHPLKGYFPFKMFSKLYELGTAVECRCDGETLYGAAAFDGNRFAALLTCYSPDRNDNGKIVTLEISGMPESSILNCYRLDEVYTMTPVTPVMLSGGKAQISLSPCGVVLLTSH